MSVPLVSVVTATWGRPKTLVGRAIPSVLSQTHRPVQHIVVTDGDDPDLSDALRESGYHERNWQHRLVQLGRNWTGFSGDGGQGAVPRLVGAFLAAGDYICYLDDDDEFLPNHVAALADALTRTGADLVCCRWRTPDGQVFGSAPPRVGATGTSMFMHRAELLKTSAWQLDGYAGDGKLVERWIDAGASWVFLEEPTVVYHAQNFGRPE